MTKIANFCYNVCMQTLNISVPQSLAEKIDDTIKNEGYASRSEFFRALARFYLLTKQQSELSLLPFKKVSLAQVEKGLRQSGQYNEKFIKSVVKGLSRSSLYAQNKTIKS